MSLTLTADSPAAEDREPSVFREPWEAEVFALTLALHERGLFAWSEWTQALGAEICWAQAAGESDRADTYYLSWLAALERIVTVKCAASLEELTRYRNAWDQAAGRTPHGQPIELALQDFAAERVSRP